MTLLQFEVKNPDETLVFVRVLDTFEHHYTKETMRRVRIDYVTDEACVDFLVLNEAEFQALLDLRVNKND